MRKPKHTHSYVAKELGRQIYEVCVYDRETRIYTSTIVEHIGPVLPYYEIHPFIMSQPWYRDSMSIVSSELAEQETIKVRMDATLFYELGEVYEDEELN